MTEAADTTPTGAGPLVGLRILELAAVGPGPHAAMILADLGADVVRVDRRGGSQLGRPDASDPMLRGRRRVDADLKTPEGHATVMALVEHADALLEGYRPGVAERLGVGPEDCLAVNPRLVYARATGWGPSGPYADRPGHDMNYMAISGALHAIGPRDAPPPPPLNLVADYGGGSMLLLSGVLAGLWHAQRTGVGQVVDASMLDGVTTLAQKVWSFIAQDRWIDEREANFIDGAAPWYRCYTCSDGGYMAVAAIEAPFYAHLLQGLGLQDEPLPEPRDRSAWPQLSARFEAVFVTRTRAEWTAIFDELDACTTPVLSWGEAAAHPQNLARENLVARDGVVQAAPVPRFSSTPLRLPPPLADPIPLDDVLADW